MKVILILAAREVRDALRNRWIIASVLCLGGLAMVLSLVGTTPVGSVRAAPLVVSVANLSSLSVYLLPLLALMLAFDALVGEAERGTLSLLLTYPVARWQVIVGKFAGHSIVLALAVVLGYGSAGILLGARAGSAEGWLPYLGMTAASVALGAVFLAIGYVVSVIARERATAAGAAISTWLAFVVLYDLALLGALMLDDNQVISQQLFGALMLANPTDVYRILNLANIDTVATVTGMTGLTEAAALGNGTLLASLAAWIIVPLLLAFALFHSKEI